MTPKCKPQRILGRLEALAAASSSPCAPGVSRVAWSEPWQRCLELVASWATQAGLATRVDEVGNLVADLPGHRDLGCIATGSHLDSVPGGGNLDGAYGVVAAIEVLSALAEKGGQPRHPLRAVAFSNEEGVVAPAFTGSRAAIGALDLSELDRCTLEKAGLDLAASAELRWCPPPAAFLELHIEQGPRLESAGAAIGVVTAIAGQQRGHITIEGQARHAGTTPMEARADALLAAAEVVLAVSKLPELAGLETATAGSLSVSPGVANVVPGRAEVSFDLRSGELEHLADGLLRLQKALEEVDRRRRTRSTLMANPPVPPVATSPRLSGLIAQAAKGLGLPSMELLSGAGHDAAIMASACPVGVIFVPSRGGISHHPDEASDEADLVAGVEVLLETIVAADRELDA